MSHQAPESHQHVPIALRVGLTTDEIPGVAVIIELCLLIGDK